jgi:DNA-binding NarL/FixJ family response regulator
MARERVTRAPSMWHDCAELCMKPRLAIVDDHTLLAEAFQALLEPGCEVVGTYSDPRAFLADAVRIKPDVTILDVSMPLLNGLDTARELTRLLPNTRIIFLTMNEDPDVAAEAFRLGAAGYLLKRSASAELPLAVREVLNHRYYITPLLTKDLVGSLFQEQHSRKPIYQLTTRQREVLQLLAEGRSMKEAADILHVSPRTVAFHKYRMMEHLQVHSTAALIQFALREGLV